MTQRIRGDDQARFWSKVEKTDTCWLWIPPPDGYGYGQFAIGGRVLGAHRVSYQWLVGPVPEGLQLDHLCRVRHCVNPRHLEPVTPRENVMRGLGPKLLAGRERRPKTHCKHGHPFDPENTYVRPNGKRNCRICRQRQSAEQWQKEKRRTAAWVCSG